MNTSNPLVIVPLAILGLIAAITLLAGAINALEGDGIEDFVDTVSWPLFVPAILWRKVSRVYFPRCDHCRAKVRLAAKHCHGCGNPVG